MVSQKADKGIETVIKAEPEQIPVKAIKSFVKAESELVPEMPKKSALASKYPRLADIYNKLEKQNTAIYEREKQLKIQIANMKQYLSSIVQGYGYKNVKEFLAEFKVSKAEYADYQSAVAKWEQQTGNKAEPDSLKAKLQRKTQEVKERENNRKSYHYRSDRGGR